MSAALPLPLSAPGCRYISRALALCLHESADCSKYSARDEQRVSILLALAFPGQVQPPGLRRQPPPVPRCGSNRKRAARTPDAGLPARGEAVSFIRDQATRENALSCLCSIVKVHRRIGYPLRARNRVNEGRCYCAILPCGRRCRDQPTVELPAVFFVQGLSLSAQSRRQRLDSFSRKQVGTLSAWQIESL